jgi:peptidoglycan hydrolase CwlO-like protein
MKLKDCLPKILVGLLFFLFCFIIIGHVMKNSILEGMKNNKDDEDHEVNEHSSGSTPNVSNNTGDIQFLKESMKELKKKVMENHKDIAKLDQEAEQVKKNTKAIHHNSNAIMKANISQLSGRKKKSKPASKVTSVFKPKQKSKSASKVTSVFKPKKKSKSSPKSKSSSLFS